VDTIALDRSPKIAAPHVSVHGVDQRSQTGDQSKWTLAIDEQWKPWEYYESVAVDLLNRFAEGFGLDRVEAKQQIQGKTTTWNIEAKGVRDSDGATILVECRRKKRKLNQEAMAAIAYRIQDVGAKGGIVVTPLELQSGASRIANAKRIVAVPTRPKQHTRRLCDALSW
jgi:hypothetical protein